MLLVSYAYLPGGGRQPTAAAALVDDAGREPAFTEVAETWHGLVQKVVDRIHEEFGDRSLRIQHVPLTTDAERPLLEVLRDDPRTIGQL